MNYINIDMVREKVARRHVLYILMHISFIALISFIIFFYFIFFYRPLYKAAEYWIPEIDCAKDIYADNLSKSKIIILSGSNCLFGFHSAAMEQAASMPVLNLSVHGGLRWEILLERASLHTKAGDILILPLEYEYYSSRPVINTWEAHQLSTWGRGYLSVLPRDMFFGYVRQLFPEYLARLRHFSKALPVRSREEIQAILQRNQGLLSRNGEGYTLEESNKYGEFFIDRALKEKTRDFLAKGYAYYQDHRLSEYVQERLLAFRALAQERGARLYVTYPATAENALFSMKNPEHKAACLELARRVEALGISFIGTPESANFDPMYFFDTQYHLNAEGAVLRTMLLADIILRDILGGQDINEKQHGGYLEQRQREAREYMEAVRTAERSTVAEPAGRQPPQ